MDKLCEARRFSLQVQPAPELREALTVAIEQTLAEWGWQMDEPLLEAIADCVIAPALAEARAAERERCAKVAEDYEGRGIDPGDGYHAQLGDASLTRREIATTIRALSPHPGI